VEDSADVLPATAELVTEADNPVTETTEDDSSNDPGMVLRDDLPDDLHVVTQKSSLVEAVWRRLRSSKNYRPLLYAAWEQNRTDYYPPMRVHNQEVMDTQLRPPTHILVAELSAEDPLAAYRSTFYQLDGSVQLRRSRFLHLFLDLEYRQGKLQRSGSPDLFTDSSSQTETDVANSIHVLKQNRQIRTNRMQYFDTPYFGALVLVTTIAAN
jgi:hypothetical protein